MAPVFGYWELTIITANLSFPQEFNILESDPDPATANRNQWIVGVVNAAPYLAASMAGCWAADPVNLFLGRRGAIFISAIVRDLFLILTERADLDVIIVLYASFVYSVHTVLSHC
jgi:hypothetical protein